MTRTAARLVLAWLAVLRPVEAGAAVTLLLDRAWPARTPAARAEVAHEDRPVLSASASWATVGFEQGTVPASRAALLPIHPPPPPGREAVFEAKAVIAVEGHPTRTRVVELAVDAPTVRIAFEPGEAGATYHCILLARWPVSPGGRAVTLRPVPVPAGARLEVRVAFEEDGCADHPPTALGIDAVVDGHGRPLLRRRLDVRRGCGAWTKLAIPLAAFAGREVAFRFRARAASRGDRARRLHVLWADPLLVSPSTAPASRPNVVLISLDTLAARHVGAYGYPRPTTPHLDALAGESVLFANVLSHYPSTPASHMTMLTGMLPVRHGVRDFHDRLADAIPTLAERLRAAGYATGAVTEDGLVHRGMGFARGFQVYRETHEPVVRGTALHTFRHGLHWLATAPPEPFFLFLHTYEVHSPYTPTPPYLRLVRPEGGPADAVDDAWRYDAEIRFLDRALAHLLDRLRRRGLLERTVLLVTADHGESFGEHGHTAHGLDVYDEVMRVPLLLRAPGLPRGVRVAAPVGLMDVTPTILDLAGLPAAPELPGRSLRRVLDDPAAAPRALVGEVHGLPVSDPARDTDLRCVWLGDRKAILDRQTGRWEVYDLRADPAERHGLGAADAAPTIAEAGAVLAAYDSLATPAAGAGENAAPTSPELLQRLRALGYVQ